MNIEQFKYKVIGVTNILGGGLIYDEDDLPDDWDNLAEEIRIMAKHAAYCANRLAGYAGSAKRQALKGNS